MINPDGNRTVSYYKKDSAVTISVDPGDTKESDWLCASEDENKTISPVKQGDKLTFSIGKIEQPYTVACNTFAPATLNIKFYTFVNNERYNVLNEEIPVIKDTTTKPGTVYYYISNDELKSILKNFITMVLFKMEQKSVFIIPREITIQSIMQGYTRKKVMNVFI